MPADREKIICMFCGQEILVSEALGEKKEEVDPVRYGESYNQALLGLEDLIGACHDPMQEFKKDLYEGSFEAYYAAHRSLFEAMEYVYRSEENKEQWLAKMAQHFVETAKNDISSIKSKNKQSQRQQDLNFLVSIYMVPCILKYPASMSEPFTDRLLEEWNGAFKVKLGKARFADIESGFHKKLCYITTAVCESLGKGTDCYELTLLKSYRDNYLEPTPEGHKLVAEYYDIAPTIVKRMEKEPDSKKLYREIYDRYLRPCIHEIEEQRMEECKELYFQMVTELKEKYFH